MTETVAMFFCGVIPGLCYATNGNGNAPFIKTSPNIDYIYIFSSLIPKFTLLLCKLSLHWGCTLVSSSLLPKYTRTWVKVPTNKSYIEHFLFIEQGSNVLHLNCIFSGNNWETPFFSVLLFLSKKISSN